LAFTTTVGAGGTSLIGTSGVDTVALNAGAVIAPIFIGAQADNDIVTLTAATNTATVDMGTGADIVNTNAAVGTSTVRGNDGNDTINITAGLRASWFNGNAGNDNITVAGTMTASSIHGGQGNDTINANGLTFNGGRINGNIGDDTISVSLSANMTGIGTNAATINGGQGADVINAFGANAIVSGDDGNHVLTTFAGNDTIYGGSGQDLISGGFNADTMVGGDGVDTFTVFSLSTSNTTNTTTTGVYLNGATFAASVNTTTISSATTAVFTVGSSAGQNDGAFDVITDFTAGLGGDRIDLVNANQITAVGINELATVAGVGNFAISGTYNSTTGTFTAAATRTQGADTLIISLGGGALTNGQAVVLTNVNATQLVASNIV